MENGILIVKTCLIAWWIVEFPLFGVITQLINDFFNKKDNELIKYVLTKPTSCFRCSSFYVGLIMMFVFNGPWWLPLISSFLMDQWDKKYNYVKI